MKTSQLYLSLTAAAFAFLLLGSAAVAGFLSPARAQTSDANGAQRAAGRPYARMPLIAPIGVRTGKYMDIPPSARGPAVDPAKGYRLQDLGSGLYMVTDNAYQYGMTGGLIYFNEVHKGGHFAAWEQTDLFAAELRAAFRSL